MKWANPGHEFDELGKALSKRTDVYIYGAGKRGLDCYHAMKGAAGRAGWTVRFVDKNPAKHGGRQEGVPIVSFPDLLAADRERSLVVVTPATGKLEILEELARHGFLPMRDSFTDNWYLDRVLPVHLVYQRNLAFMPSINYVVTTSCNLNCFGCLNFSPLIAKHITFDLAAAKSDMDVFFGAVDLVNRFQFTGGEPFLYGDLARLMEYVGSRYGDRISSLEVVTNGTIVPDDVLCRVMRQRGVLVLLDDYRQTVEEARRTFEVVAATLRSFGVRLAEVPMGDWVDIHSGKNRDKRRDDAAAALQFDRCGCPWSTLENGRISACNYSRYIAKAGLYPDAEDEYFDLRAPRAAKKKELIEFRLGFNTKGFTEFCRACSGYMGHVNPDTIKAAVQMPRRRDSLDGGNA